MPADSYSKEDMVYLLDLQYLKTSRRKFLSPTAFTNFNSQGLGVGEAVRLFASFDALPWRVRLWSGDGEVLFEMKGIAGKGKNMYQLVYVDKDGEETVGNPMPMGGGKGDDVTGGRTMFLLELALHKKEKEGVQVKFRRRIILFHIILDSLE